MTTHARDSATTVIGSKTENGRRHGHVPEFRRSGHKAKPIMVDIKAGGEVIGEIDLITLTRFSTLAAELFPKPVWNPISKVAPSPSRTALTGAPVTITQDKEVPPPLIVHSLPLSATQQKANTSRTLTFPIAVRPHGQKTKPVPPPPPPATIIVPTPVIQERKLLDLDQYCHWHAPSAHAVNFVLSWMRRAKSTRRDEIPPPCAVAKSPPQPKSANDICPYDPFLCELYAATEVLGIRPTPFQARKDLMNNISGALPTLAMLQHIHSLVSNWDPVMSRTINAYFDRVTAVPYLADEGEIDKIHKYVSDKAIDEELFGRFRKEQNHRRGRERAERRRQEQGGTVDWGRVGARGGQGVQGSRGGAAGVGGQEKKGGQAHQGRQAKQVKR